MRTSATCLVLAAVQAHGLRKSHTRESTQSETEQDWIVLFKDGVSDEDIHRFCAGRCSLMGHPDSGGVAYARVRGGSDVMGAMSASSAMVDLVERDAVDYMIPEIDEMATSDVASWGLERIGVPSRQVTGKGQTIYVQDTGVRSSHTDFGGRSASALDMTSGSPVACNGDATCAVDRQGHGTHCAGTAAGETLGVASAAAVRAVKTLSDRGSGARSWQMAAIDWVVKNGVKPSVISMSLGGNGRDSAYTRAIGAASAAGITVVVAAGNSNSDACNFSPAFAQDAITVGATTNANRRASYSNYGSCLNIYAPGSAIVSADAGSDTGTRSLSGTSMACPHVSGAAALWLETNPTLNKDQILSQMLTGGRKGFVAGRKPNDPDEFLWVGSEPAPAPPPTTTPPPTPAPPPSLCPADTTSGPDSDGDCRCNAGLLCFNNDKRGCPVKWSQSLSTRYHHASCTTCQCL